MGIDVFSSIKRSIARLLPIQVIFLRAVAVRVFPAAIEGGKHRKRNAWSETDVPAERRADLMRGKRRLRLTHSSHELRIQRSRISIVHFRKPC